LNIYKEDGGNDGESKSDEPDLSNGIRFKRNEEDEESGFELKTNTDAANSSGKPMI